MKLMKGAGQYKRPAAVFSREFPINEDRDVGCGNPHPKPVQFSTPTFRSYLDPPPEPPVPDLPPEPPVPDVSPEPRVPDVPELPDPDIPEPPDPIDELDPAPEPWTDIAQPATVPL